jgi:hypothetical protein
MKLSFIVSAEFDDEGVTASIDTIKWYADKIRDVLDSNDCGQAEDFDVVPAPQVPELLGLSVRARNALHVVGVSLQHGTVDDVRRVLPHMRPGRPRHCGITTLVELRAFAAAKDAAVEATR